MKTPWSSSGRVSALVSVPSIFWKTVFFSSLYSKYFSFVKFLYNSALWISFIYFCHILQCKLNLSEVNNLRLCSTGPTLFWIGHNLLRDRVLKYVTERKIEGRWVRGRRREKLLDDLKETRGYWNWKRKHWIARCGEFVLEGSVYVSYGRLHDERRKGPVP